MNHIDYRGAKILIVDDNPANIDILIELLDEYDVRAVLDGESALEAVKEETPELVLLDITLPGIDGFEVCRRLKNMPGVKEIPVIFLSASTDDASIVKGFELGGVDYITKPYRAKEILARVKTHVQLFRAMRKVEKIAMTDELTGIANRRKFFLRTPRLIEQAKAKDIPLFLMIIDLDNFKPINDRYGHDVGDRILKAFTQSAKELLPPNSCFGRLGGDEFCIVLGGKQEKIFKQMEMLRAMIEKMGLSGLPQLKVTLSIGIAKLSESDDSIRSLLKRADEALYKAKESGGNKIIANIAA